MTLNCRYSEKRVGKHIYLIAGIHQLINFGLLEAYMLEHRGDFGSSKGLCRA